MWIMYIRLSVLLLRNILSKVFDMFIVGFNSVIFLQIILDSTNYLYNSINNLENAKLFGA